MVDTILTHPFFTTLVLPFLLVFTLVFAILDKTNILGKGKKQINAIISFVIGLIFTTFAYYVHITTQLLGIMAVIAVILLVFMILIGFVYSGEKGFEMPKALKTFLGILIGIALIIALLVITGTWSSLMENIDYYLQTNLARNILFIIVIVVGIWIVIGKTKKQEINVEE